MDIKKYSIILYNLKNYYKIKNKMNIITNLKLIILHFINRTMIIKNVY
jgi:hypothetical protein